MASSSSEKTMEDPSPTTPPPPPRTPSTPSSETPMTTHVALPRALIEKLRSIKNWGEMYRWMYDDEKIRRVWEIQHNMDVNDLLDYVMYGEGEEVVWDDDVWELQRIVHTPDQDRQPVPSPPPQPPKMTETNAYMNVDVGDQPPSPPAEGSPNTEKITALINY
ncbi:OLC1v1025709C1 [Oldenlandia corymbosa var. corymbosa]|uniref:OLC1v1025709C1 n=1 Tax=Oldenlandia corymbosa var. corymbosa TaxID=529605 RepID=A0AAV1C622_OLDCO|nr:OLC1v1025709C1 [Oldenlandia corymbosa var. corymbosa]